MSKIYPVIMSGGAGSRLWPLSRQRTPKQLLPLIGEQTMIQATVDRFQGDEFADPVFICNALHVEAINAQMQAIGREIDAIIVEPMGRNTAPCAVVAARHVMARDPDALVLLVPADQHINDPAAFRGAVSKAADTARQGRLVTFGITPDSPQTGYGYIEGGDELAPGVFDVGAFREKPDLETAKTYLEAGTFSWNGGLFLFSPDTFLNEVEQFVPEIGRIAAEAYDKSNVDGTTVNLDADLFGACPSESIDYAVMEHTQKAAVVPVDMGWSDIGSYASLHERTKSGADGNAVRGDVLIHNVTNSLIHTDGPSVSVIGLDNVAVVAADGKILVVDLDSSQDVKAIVGQLKAAGRNQDL